MLNQNETMPLPDTDDGVVSESDIAGEQEVLQEPFRVHRLRNQHRIDEQTATVTARVG